MVVYAVRILGDVVLQFADLPSSNFAVDVYEVPKQLTSGGDGDGDGDKRLADEFRRQYMDDVAKRRQLRKKKPVQPPKPRSENVLRGPKLGGSRNSRAAVRNALLQEKKDAKK